MNNMLITMVQQNGYPILWLGIFIAAAGIPLPGMLLLVAAGAFAGLGDFNPLLLAPLALSAAIAGDTVGYVIGRQVGHRVLEWLAKRHRLRIFSPHAIAQSQDYFKRRGAWAIFLTRFLFAALGGLTNLLAGLERYPYRRFLLFDISGQAFGVFIPLVLGYLFAESWEALGELMGAVSGLLLALLAAAILIAFLARNSHRTARQLMKDEQF